MTGSLAPVVVEIDPPIRTLIPALAPGLGPLSSLEEAVRLLAMSRDLTEVMAIRDAAEAARLYARAISRGLEAQNHAAEIKIRAEVRAGELLAELPRTQGARTDLDLETTSDQAGPKLASFAETLEQADIGKANASRWQAMATLPADALEQHIAETRESGRELTSAGVLKLARPAVFRARTPVVLGERQPTSRLLVGDVRACLASLEPDSVQCVVTSPPYWGLRSYSTTPQVWGQTCCEHPHEWSAPLRAGEGYAAGGRRRWQHVGGRAGMDEADWEHQAHQGRFCEHEHAWGDVTTPGRKRGATCDCGAWLGELGNEPTPQMYVDHIVEVFRSLRRVLRSDGVLWLNMGDAYAGSGRGPTGYNGIGDQEQRQGFTSRNDRSFGSRLHGGDLTVDVSMGGRAAASYKPKDLVPTPWLVAMALQADGWYWRSTVAWCKRAPMPESVRDRPTSAWEPVFLFAKSERYFWNADAARDAETGHNLWDYWLLGPEPFPGAHFATFPTAIPETCILASSKPGDLVLDPFAGAGTTLLVAGRLGRDSVGIELNESYARMAAERITAEGIDVAA
jgi:site-specific DNA-methyltransferase (adenine-specific)